MEFHIYVCPIVCVHIFPRYLTLKSKIRKQLMAVSVRAEHSRLNGVMTTNVVSWNVLCCSTGTFHMLFALGRRMCHCASAVQRHQVQRGCDGLWEMQDLCIFFQSKRDEKQIEIQMCIQQIKLNQNPCHTPQKRPRSAHFPAMGLVHQCVWHHAECESAMPHPFFLHRVGSGKKPETGWHQKTEYMYLE